MIFNKSPNRTRLGRNSLSFVFLPGGETASDVALQFVSVKDFADLFIQRFIALGKSLLQILVDSRFGYVEVLGGGTDCGACLDDVHS